MSRADHGNSSEEARWVCAAQAGDTAAFRQLIDAYERRLYYFLRRFLPRTDQVLDVLQEVWLTLFRRLPALREPAAFRVWLYQVAHDRVVSVIRKERREQDVVAEYSSQLSDESAPLDLSTENAELVHRALAVLSADHREAIVLHFLEDMKLEEMADVLGVPAGTVKSRLFYARQALRRELERLGHE
ncbi:MAG: RNA polymerase sigma factor [Gemmataceae bacterium]